MIELTDDQREFIQQAQLDLEDGDPVQVMNRRSRRIAGELCELGLLKPVQSDLYELTEDGACA